MTTNQDNTTYIAAIAYLTFIGWIIALLVNNSNKSELTSFHLRQMLGLMIMYVTVSVLDTLISFPILFWILYLGVLLLWVIGLIAAIRKEKVLIPIVGHYFQDWFRAL